MSSSSPPLFPILPTTSKPPPKTGLFCPQCTSLKFTNFTSGFIFYLQTISSSSPCDFCAYISYLLFRPKKWDPAGTKRIEARMLAHFRDAFDKLVPSSSLRFEVLNTDINDQREQLYQRHPEMAAKEPAFIDFNVDISQLSRSIHIQEMLYVRKTMDGNRVECEEGLKHGMVTRWADLPHARAWLENCLETHGECRWKTGGEALHPSTKFIDVQEHRLVNITETMDPQFVALSYVWGPPPHRQTVRGNFGAHSRHLPPCTDAEDRLPKTIQDAMKVTREMGFRYLWVDALCIVQDDPAEVKTQILQMNKVYGQAAFTIINQGGKSADDGIPGVSIPRDISVEIQLPNGITLGCWDVVADFWENDTEKVYGSRGWTLQEQMLSRRKLVFDVGRMLFECDTHTVVESGEPAPSQVISGFRRAITSTSTDLNALEAAWKKTKIDFSNRNLSVIGDRLNAISGIISEITTITADKYLCGHNPNKLYHELLWRIDYDSSREAKKFDLRATSFSSDSSGLFPSWSWLNLWPIHFSSKGYEDRYTPFPDITLEIVKNSGLWELVITAPMRRLYPRSRTQMYAEDGMPVDIDLRLDPPYGSFPEKVECVPLARVNPGVGVWSSQESGFVEAWYTGVVFVREVEEGGYYVRVGIGLVAKEMWEGERVRRIICR
ncbi:heterokaryon incompatibility protein-domain-containing protein [Trichophaea hybrida]|nr:heterokaryon incompatibility protein-domain-containing protein [Trichophaea hybrida]